MPPTPKPTPYITPSETPPNEPTGQSTMDSILPVSTIPSSDQNQTATSVVEANKMGHNFDYLTNALMLDYCNNWVVFDRSSASSRRFVDIDFGRPILLTGFIIPANVDVLSVAVDVWLNQDDDKNHKARRLCTHTRLRQEPFVMINIQPPPLCRFVRLWTVFAVGAAQGRLSMCVGQYYGYSLLAPCRMPNAQMQYHRNLAHIVSSHHQVMQSCIEDQLYRFKEAMQDMTAVQQVYASPNHLASLWTSGQRAVETRYCQNLCLYFAFVY